MRRNVLLVTADQWRGDCLSSRGHPVVETPNFDALAREGVTFPGHYSVCAPCGPARASLLTGMYMHNHRSVRNGTPLEDRHTNIAREARKAGYRPTLFGYTDTSLDPYAHGIEDVTRHGYESLMPGFEEGLLLPGERPQAWLDDLAAKGYPVTGYEEAFTPGEAPPTGRGRSAAPAIYTGDDSQTAFLARRCIEYLERAQPGWFVHLSWFRPHPPFIAPRPWNTRYDPSTVPAPLRAPSMAEEAAVHPWVAAANGPGGDWFETWMRDALGTPRYDAEIRELRATYYALVSKVDHYFGGIMDCLRARGHLDNTLIVVTSDHGELLGDHFLFGKRGYFDGGFHVPLIVFDPTLGPAGRGRVVDRMTESVDVMPTILDWLGIDVPRQCDGRSLLPLTRGESVPGGDAVRWEYDFRNDDDGDGVEQELGLSPDECVISVLRDREYKYVHFAGLEPLFFDLRDGSNETVNVANHPDYREAMITRMRRMLSWRQVSAARALTHLRVGRDGVRARRVEREAPGRADSTA